MSAAKAKTTKAPGANQLIEALQTRKRANDALCAARDKFAKSRDAMAVELEALKAVYVPERDALQKAWNDADAEVTSCHAILEQEAEKTA